MNWNENSAMKQNEAHKIEDDYKIIKKFRTKTERLFDKGPFGGMSPSHIEKIVREKVVDIVRNYEMDVTIEEIIVSGSRCRGLERDESDLDVVLSYYGSVREDTLFNILNEERMTIGGLEVDINPLNTEHTGNLSDYLLGVEKYLSEKTGKTNA